MRAYTGFDSAWTDNQAKPGAILTIFEDADGKRSSGEPMLATFGQAAEEIAKVNAQASFHLVAIDQPTIVKNVQGCRPVERVASSLICKLKGGVQPANRGKVGMFCERSAIWPFLDSLPHNQDPAGAMSQKPGRYILEVFPALTLAAWIPEVIRRTRGAKYNPERKTFSLDDWKLVCTHIAERAQRHGVASLQKWVTRAGEIERPRKGDQDKLDSAICALIALEIVCEGRERNAIIGDLNTGYIVTPVTAEIMTILSPAALRHGVPINNLTSWT